MHGKLQHHLHIFIVSLVERSDVIENISIHWHCFFGGAEIMGSSRIIETHMVFHKFPFLFSVERRAWEDPTSLETNGFLCTFIFSLVERRRWEAP